MEWLLEGPPWVKYRTRLDLLGQSESDPEVQTARQAMLTHPQVRTLLTELAGWPGPPLTRHNDASHPLHKLAFAADLGLRVGDPGVDPVVERILDHPSPEGMFQVVMNIPTHFGGSGKDQLAWALCDAPLILYALAKFGLQEDGRVQTAARHLAGLIRDNGWPCAATPDFGKFKGPGRKDDPCPYANLVMLKALSQMQEWRDSDVCRTGAETLLNLWEQRKERRPYLFAMGTDFCKLKAPFIWYDILHVTDVLTQFVWLLEDRRLREMASMVEAKADERGRFTPESVWKAWAGWDFGQKHAPSPWLTLLAWRMLRRLER
jgi:hypothetical protein